ncbi:hypothetical protein ACSBR2_006783 [Camellia fascicularis]
MAEDLLTQGPSQHRSFRSIVEDARHLFLRCNWSIQRIPREANHCADKLANMRADQVESLVVVEEPPIAVRTQIVAEMIGMEYRRI